MTEVFNQVHVFSTLREVHSHLCLEGLLCNYSLFPRFANQSRVQNDKRLAIQVYEYTRECFYWEVIDSATFTIHELLPSSWPVYVVNCRFGSLRFNHPFLTAGHSIDGQIYYGYLSALSVALEGCITGPTRVAALI